MTNAEARDEITKSQFEPGQREDTYLTETQAREIVMNTLGRILGEFERFRNDQGASHPTGHPVDGPAIAAARHGWESAFDTAETIVRSGLEGIVFVFRPETSVSASSSSVPDAS